MAHDIIDAEFETIRRNDGNHPAEKAKGFSDLPANRGHENQIDILKTASPAKALPGQRVQIAYVLSVLFSSIAAFLLSGGHVLLRAAPATHPTLALEMATRPPVPERMRNDVMTVSATVRNATGDIQQVPDVLLTFRSAEGASNLVYRVPRGETLHPGKSLAFTVRMPKKPGYKQAPSLKFDKSGV